MSDFKDKPDDWSKTTPNINMPGGRPGGKDPFSEPDWAKTNYRINVPQTPAPPQAAPPDDFGKTITNIKPIDTNRQDFGKTMYPGAAAQPPGDWGATQANINVPSNAAPPAALPNDFAPGPDKTTPYFQLPEADRLRYQQLPPTPTEAAEQAEQEEKSKGGIPGWVWVVAGLMVMFFFAVAVLGGVYFFVLRDASFQVIVKGSPAGSDIKVDNQRVAVSDANGDSVIDNLAPGSRVITIDHPSYECQPQRVEGGRGVNPDPVVARCKAQTVKPTDDCATIGIGEEDKAERCYNAALDALPTPFTPDQLVKALNILIINFETNSSTISPRRMVAIKKGAEYIKRLPANVVLEIGGHTDNVGSAGSNQTLSEARANSVKTALVGFGVNQTILEPKGYGMTRSRPDVDGNSDLGRFLNRRIEYSILKQ